MRRIALALAALCLTACASAQTGAPPEPAAIERDALRQLLTIRRVYVDRLTGGETAEQIRDILISALQGANLFVVTENPDRADAVLRGGAEDLIFTEEHSSASDLSVRANMGNTRTTSGSRGQYGGMGAGESESERSSERRHESIAAIRLVNKEGDVIWAATEESNGAKFRGASADVAGKITARLKEDFERARKLPR